MGTLKNLDSTGIYAYTTLISCIICVPAALIMEGPYLKAAADKALESHPNFYMQLALVGLLYHLYNQAGAPFTCTLAAATHLTNLPAHQLCLPAGFCRDALQRLLHSMQLGLIGFCVLPLHPGYAEQEHRIHKLPGHACVGRHIIPVRCILHP